MSGCLANLLCGCILLTVVLGVQGARACLGAMCSLGAMCGHVFLGAMCCCGDMDVNVVLVTGAGVCVGNGAASGSESARSACPANIYIHTRDIHKGEILWCFLKVG